MTKLKPNQFLLQGHLITELPIIFQTEMVQANLEDRKNQTRRTNLLKEINQSPDSWELIQVCHSQVHHDNIKPDDFVAVFNHRFQKGNARFFKSPFGQPGDLLWVRETWLKIYGGKWSYKAGLHPDSEDLRKDYLKCGHKWAKWKPSIHMPKIAARIWLMVEEIRVERLEDITEKDAIAEGVERWTETRLRSQPTRYKVYTNSDPEALYTSCPKDSFETLWIRINGEESWDSNPWVWVVRYRILSKTGRPSDTDILTAHLAAVKAQEERWQSHISSIVSQAYNSI